MANPLTISEIVIFMNIIMIVDFLNISIHNTKIKHGFLKCYEIAITVLGCISYQLRKFLLINLHIFHTNSCEITIQMVRQSTIMVVNTLRLS